MERLIDKISRFFLNFKKKNVFFYKIKNYFKEFLNSVEKSVLLNKI